jgi:hypothetical protein
MAYQQLTISPEKGAKIKCQFNPERYTVSKSVHYADIQIPGLDSPVVQFIRGQSEKLTMDLFFDTTDKGMVDNVTDVRTQTNNVFRLLKVNGDTHAPLRVKFEWGNDKRVINFGTNESPWCVLESVTQEFQLFSPDGTPLRAKLTVSFREAWTVEQQLRETPRHTSDRTKLITVQAGQTLSQIAGNEYDDPSAWRVIAETNNLDDPANLEPGRLLTIPRNLSSENNGGANG